MSKLPIICFGQFTKLSFYYWSWLKGWSSGCSSLLHCSHFRLIKVDRWLIKVNRSWSMVNRHLQVSIYNAKKSSGYNIHYYGMSKFMRHCYESVLYVISISPIHKGNLGKEDQYKYNVCGRKSLLLELICIQQDSFEGRILTESWMSKLPVVCHVLYLFTCTVIWAKAAWILYL